MRVPLILTLLALTSLVHAELPPPSPKGKVRRSSWGSPALGRSASGSPEVLFTFDDGPAGALTGSVLDTLKAHGIKAIFFMVGMRFTERGGRGRVGPVVDRVIAEGHAIGNHTAMHRDLCLMSNAAVINSEIDDSAVAITEVARMNMVLFRAPFGVRCARLEEALSARDMRHTHWDIDAQEWRSNDAARTQRIIIHGIERLRDDQRAVVLIHDTHAATVRALPIILDWITAENDRRTAAGRKPIRIIGPSDVALEQLAPGLRSWLAAVDAGGGGLADLERRFVAPVTAPRAQAGAPTL